MIPKYLNTKILALLITASIATRSKPLIINAVSKNVIGSNGGFYFSFFKNNWRANDQVITQHIKRCSTSDQINKIIQTHGNRLNLVHLTAILDRIQEQNMLKTSKIIQFTIQKLKMHQHYFSILDMTNIRTISNIICYLGNLKNDSLNYIFINTNYEYLKQHTNTVQTSMLITGLIRLNIFKEIIGLKHEKSKKPILLEDIINNTYTRNQLLSIWFAYISQVSKQNVVFNNFLNKLLGESIEKDQISLRTYTYAIVCYLKTCRTLEKPHQSPIFKLIKSQIPTKQAKILHPYQFSLLLHHIKIIKKQSKTIFDQKYERQHKDIMFPHSFNELLHEQYEKICKKKNVTLRNIANIFKQFSETFVITSNFLKLSLNKSGNIIKQQMNYCKNAEKYDLDFKIDLLSFANLFWKLIQNLKHFPYLYKDPSQNIIILNYINSSISYLKFLKDKDSLHRFSNKQLLMFMSGFFQLKPKLTYQLDEETRYSVVNLVMAPERQYTVKQLTLFYVYLLAIKVESKEYCLYIRHNLQKLTNTQQFSKILQAKEILSKECTLSLGEKCKKCRQLIPPNAQTQPTKQ